MLLLHWMEQNDEHAADFVGWADRVSLAGHADAAQMVIRAADANSQTNGALQSALQGLGGPLSRQPHMCHHSH